MPSFSLSPDQSRRWTLWRLQPGVRLRGCSSIPSPPAQSAPADERFSSGVWAQPPAPSSRSRCSSSATPPEIRRGAATDQSSVAAKNSTLKRALLWIPARLYELAVRLRIAAYETEYLKPKRLRAFVISVGNITLGGTGKTPLVEYLARYLADEGQSVAILTRGYARKSRGRRVLNHVASESNGSDVTQASDVEDHVEYGDEPVMMARALRDIPIVVDSDRYEGGQFAERLGADVLILDDGFQHMQLARDLNLLLIDATDPFGGLEMVPFGRLREPLYALRRADAIIVTRAHQSFDQGKLMATIKYVCGNDVPTMFVYSTIVRLRHITTNEVYEKREFAGWNASILSGIGNPEAFAEDILQAGINIVGEHFFRDHHVYSQEELDTVEQKSREAGADLIVTTEKDAVRLERLKFGQTPVYAAQLELQSDDDVRLKSLVLRALHRRRETGRS